ncbi:MAG: exodeoxyribonuclease V subunit gamma [Chlamydiia bacterium]|nr:exodeoxyribonuclease V subunit gamma [Chlamydiia bacterium]
MIRTWFEAGFDKTLDALLVSSELQVEWSDADLLEEVLFLWTSLQNELKVAEKTTLEWAQFLEPLIDTYLWVDETDDADAAAQQMVQRFLKELRLVECDWKFPLPILQHLLEKRSCRGSIHPSHLHAVKFGSLQCGCITPSRALFLIGMDEESFPRRIEASSLSLMPRKEEDRYLMLQALFAAREHWIFSYGHLSSEDGKSVEPSLALQELFSEVGGSYSVTAPPIRTFPQRKYLEDFFGLEKPWPELPQGEVTVHLTDLSRFARHPWDYYLQKELGIFLKKEPLDSFAAQRTQLAKESLQESLGKVLDRHELPPGLIGKAQQEELQKLSAKWEEQLREWHVTAATWSLLKTCRFVKKVSSHHVESPPLRISLTPELTVHIVGQLKNMSETGLISTSDDLLKIWPEALTGALLSAHPQIYLLKSLKMASIQQPEEAMRAFLLYYFRCQARASPLISPWADFFLKEGKIKKGYFEDPVADWVLSRIAMPPEDKLLEKWGWLKETFQYAKI